MQNQTTDILSRVEIKTEGKYNLYVPFQPKLIKKIVKENGKIVLSEVVKNEMISLGYSRYDLESVFLSLQKLLIPVYSNKKQFSRAKDLSKKRNIPLFDALHALIARDNRAVLITRDKHFEKLRDITHDKKPEELI